MTLDFCRFAKFLANIFVLTKVEYMSNTGANARGSLKQLAFLQKIILYAKT